MELHKIWQNETSYVHIFAKSLKLISPNITQKEHDDKIWDWKSKRKKVESTFLRLLSLKQFSASKHFNELRQPNALSPNDQPISVYPFWVCFLTLTKYTTYTKRLLKENKIHSVATVEQNSVVREIGYLWSTSNRKVEQRKKVAGPVLSYNPKNWINQWPQNEIFKAILK